MTRATNSSEKHFTNSARTDEARIVLRPYLERHWRLQAGSLRRSSNVESKGRTSMALIREDIILPEEFINAATALRQLDENRNFPSPSAAAPDLTRFGYLFPDLQLDPANRLPESPQTVQALKDLARTMAEPNAGSAGDSDIPSAYTYFGQFVDHDISLMFIPRIINLDDPNLAPLPPSEIDRIRNIRTPLLDLDSVYGEAPYVGGNLLMVGMVTTQEAGPRPPGKVGNDFDLPRRERSRDAIHDRVARIGDPRNDENTIIAQLHVAFLRAHNAIIGGGHAHCDARRLLCQHYQWILVHDFLKRVADPTIVDDLLANRRRVYDPSATRVFMPFEFAAAAYRFGHSMVRPAYDFNVNFPFQFAPLLQLFKVLGRYPTLPQKWIIQWERFVDGGTNKARRIDTQLTAPLAGVVARKNLLRGYLVRLPTGQAVARALSLPVMTAGDILAAAANQQQVRVLQDSGFVSRTPLWFYILAEATRFSGGQRLGPVGSTLVAGVLIGLIRRSKDSFLNIVGWTPTLRGVSDLPGMLRLAGVL
jgi:hypothetical protein